MENSNGKLSREVSTFSTNTDISLRSNILPNVNTKLKWKTQMQISTGKLSREVSTFSSKHSKLTFLSGAIFFQM
jgi:hypothetical protein